MMRALDRSVIKKGSIIAFLENREGKYKQVEAKTEVEEMNKKTSLKYMCTVPTGMTPRIRTIQIVGLREKPKKDKTKQLLGYEVAYGTYDKEFKSNSEKLDFLSKYEMNHILSHARLIQG